MPSKQEVGQFFTSMSYKKRGAFFLVVLYIGLGSERFKNLFYYYPKLLLNFLQAKIKPIQSSYPLELNNYQEDEPESFEQAHNPSVNFFFVKEQDLDAPDYFSPFSITH